MTRRVAVVQMESVPGQPERNFAVAQERIRHAAGEGATFIVLPECAINGYDLEWFGAGAPGASLYPGPVFENMATLGAELGISILLAELEGAPSGLYDSALIFESGRLVSRHAKMIPTRRELSAGLVPGEEPAIPAGLEGAEMAVAPMVCYEYAFPELVRDLAVAGAGLLGISAAIRSGFAHLIPVRVRARAQDNSCFALIANAAGNGFCGNSMIVDPVGAVLAQAGESESVTLFAEVDSSRIEGISRDASPTDAEHERVAEVLRRR